MNKILQGKTLHFLEKKLVEELSKYDLFQNPQINASPRAIGDTVQEVIGEILPSCFPSGLIDEFSSNFARRAMEDVAFYDADGNYYAVDIKTHNLSTDFNMPNLISVERLARFYRDEKKYFVILLVEYTVKNGHLSFTDTHFIPIEHLEWSCLTIGALGWGQIGWMLIEIIRVLTGCFLSVILWMHFIRRKSIKLTNGLITLELLDLSGRAKNSTRSLVDRRSNISISVSF